ncbi:TetR/AcrR family transcriptional regulator [Paenibacillus sp. OV219]|uniref:TetR/AcrR family transcriptional regulator n=1 Tax=Paenibacillus sp. OV219 TaxID=1884377 RepID=UPI0008C892CF|nr:TetR/AcrR family transcriptional regulator [Paenibacillus sp. OV219]SEM53011.1 transcriptional regulator, TetR family [Paenibacillus sp. OV219]
MEKNAISARWLIMEALMELLLGSSFDTITVGAIVRKAGVSRSSFYVHFLDKFDLMEQLTTKILRELEDHYETTQWNDENKQILRTSFNNKVPLPTTVDLLGHIRKYEYFYRDRYREPAFVVRLSELLGSHLKIFKDETFAIFLAYGTVGYIGRWLSEGLKTPANELALRLTNVARLSLQHIMLEEPIVETE